MMVLNLKNQLTAPFCYLFVVLIEKVFDIHTHPLGESRYRVYYRILKNLSGFKNMTPAWSSPYLTGVRVGLA
jgi:hypothetical protein